MNVDDGWTGEAGKVQQEWNGISVYCLTFYKTRMERKKCKVSLRGVFWSRKCHKLSTVHLDFAPRQVVILRIFSTN